MHSSTCYRPRYHEPASRKREGHEHAQLTDVRAPIAALARSPAFYLAQVGVNIQDMYRICGTASGICAGRARKLVVGIENSLKNT